MLLSGQAAELSERLFSMSESGNSIFQRIQRTGKQRRYRRRPVPKSGFTPRHSHLGAFPAKVMQALDSGFGRGFKTAKPSHSENGRQGDQAVKEERGLSESFPLHITSLRVFFYIYREQLRCVAAAQQFCDLNTIVLLVISDS